MSDFGLKVAGLLLLATAAVVVIVATVVAASVIVVPLNADDAEEKLLSDMMVICEQSGDSGEDIFCIYFERCINNQKYSHVAC